MARQLKRDARGRFASSGTVRNKRSETAASKPTKATKATRATAAAAGPAKAVAGPKTTTARGRALTRQRELQRQMKAERAATGTVSAKTARSAAVLDRARTRYAATGTGTKRSPTRAGKAAAAAKPAAEKKPAAKAKPAEKPARKPKAKKAATPAAAKPAARTSKKKVSTAERKYRQARSEMRQAGMYAAGRTSTREFRGRTDAGAANIRGAVKAYQGAARKVRNLEETRGVSGRKKPAAKPAKAAAPAATRGGAIVRSPGGAIVPVSRARPAARPAPASPAPRVPASQRPGSMTSTLRGTLRALAQSDARMLRDIQNLVGGPSKPRQIKGGKKPVTSGSLPAAPKKPKSRPASGRKIDDAKARRIVSRIDARRPNLRPASESHQKTMLSIRTYDRASDFILGPSMRSIKKGKGSLGVVESTKRAVANATKPRKTAKKR